MQEAPVANIINQPRELEARAVEQPKLEDTPDFVSSEHHDKYGKMVSCRESLFTIAAGLAMLLSCGVLISMWGSSAMHPRAPLVAVSGTVLGMCALAFSRRYAHADFMFGRFTMASAFLVFGFNLVAMAPTLKHALVGWNITSFASAFLIGPYNDQPTVRENVTFVFFIYQLSHYSLMVAAAFIMQPGVGDHAALAALGLVVAALLKSGQFPVTNLLMRSMEGPSPTSALAYAGLSAHLGVVLLAGTMPHWFGFFWARAILASVGLLSAGIAGLVCKIRADRKGALASATVSTLGLIYVVLAAGYADTALVLSLGHTTFRMLQFLRSPNFLLDTHNLLMVLHDEMRPQSVPVWLYKICWVLNRFNNAFQMPHVLRLFRWCKVPTPSESTLHKFQMSKFLQWMLVIPLVVLAGMPFTPVERDRDRFFTGLLNSSHHFQAGFLMALDVVMSTLLMRFVFANVLDAKRFRHQAGDGCCAHLCII
jgi:NADH:ubiquinone oxidoreductase subunit 5 (subunit L)/multisubunit Na+/H+ antiporter MnhA subunit